jgi:hypothetical protein
MAYWKKLGSLFFLIFLSCSDFVMSVRCREVDTLRVLEGDIVRLKDRCFFVEIDKGANIKELETDIGKIINYGKAGRMVLGVGEVENRGEIRSADVGTGKFKNLGQIDSLELGMGELENRGFIKFADLGIGSAINYGKMIKLSIGVGRGENKGSLDSLNVGLRF